RHRADADAGPRPAAEQVLLGAVLAVKVGAAGADAHRDAGHRDDGGAVLGLDGLADDGVGVGHLAHLVHRHVHQPLNRMLSHNVWPPYKLSSVRMRCYKQYTISYRKTSSTFSR